MINYTLITKPGIIMGNLITMAAGFLLASHGKFYPQLFFATLLGLGFIIASACVFNNYIDRHIDKQMERTKQRALAAGLISEHNAIYFALILLFIGSLLLITQTNWLTFELSIAGFAIYVFCYSLWKPHTLYATAIGSIAGAIPPVVGYVAVSNRLDIGALLLFLILVFWQMAHFHAIAIYRMQDYNNAHIPTLPQVKGLFRTKLHILVYILLFIPVSLLLTYFGYTGKIYFAITATIGLAWLWLSFKGFNTEKNVIWGKRMFYVSLVMINVLSIGIAIDSIKS